MEALIQCILEAFNCVKSTMKLLLVDNVHTTNTLVRQDEPMTSKFVQEHVCTDKTIEVNCNIYTFDK